nr:BURP domain-containing protein 4-like isoform X5 [Lolium perenne]
MEAKVVSIAFVLLLLTFGKNAKATTANPVTRNEGDESPTPHEDDFGVSAYPAKWSPSTSQKDDFGVSAYPAKWNPSISQEDDFGVSAYPAKWNPSTSHKDDFDVSAYPAKWIPSTSEEDDFGVSSYPAKWNPSTSQEDDFGASAYPAKWNPSTSQEGDFGVSAYPAKWNPSTSHEDDFDASAYPAKWIPSTSKEDDFGVSAYPAKWNPSTSQEDDFGASAYPAKWNPSTSQEGDFGVSAYPAKWNPSTSHSPIPQAQMRHQQIKVQTGMLFLKKSLHVGTVLPEGTMFTRVGMPKSDSSAPLESKYFGIILSHFKIPHNSVKAKQVADTIRSCDKPSDKEEPHMCFSSRGAMQRFSTKVLGVLRVRQTVTRIYGHETPSSRYTVVRITPLSTKMVPCHPMDFPYEVFYCHRPKEVQSFRVQLKDKKNGMPLVTTTAMCHMNTSDWDKQYFEMLGGVRGEPICHYMPQNYIMFY